MIFWSSGFSELVVVATTGFGVLCRTPRVHLQNHTRLLAVGNPLRLVVLGFLVASGHGEVDCHGAIVMAAAREVSAWLAGISLAQFPSQRKKTVDLDRQAPWTR